MKRGLPLDQASLIHLAIERVLDDFRRNDRIPEETIVAALIRAARASHALTAASRQMSPIEQHRR
jgi:hypothetical protein